MEKDMFMNHRQIPQIQLHIEYLLCWLRRFYTRIKSIHGINGKYWERIGNGITLNVSMNTPKSSTYVSYIKD
jgi:hypothetical protein